MSMKRALKGRPDAFGLGTGFAVCVEMPCASSRFARKESAAAPMPSWTNLRRPKIMTQRAPGRAARMVRVFAGWAYAGRRDMAVDCRSFLSRRRNYSGIGELQPETHH